MVLRPKAGWPWGRIKRTVDVQKHLIWVHLSFRSSSLDCVTITPVILPLLVASSLWLAVGPRSLQGGLFTNF